MNEKGQPSNNLRELWRAQLDSRPTITPPDRLDNFDSKMSSPFEAASRRRKN